MVSLMAGCGGWLGGGLGWEGGNFMSLLFCTFQSILNIFVIKKKKFEEKLILQSGSCHCNKANDVVDDGYGSGMLSKRNTMKITKKLKKFMQCVRRTF